MTNIVLDSSAVLAMVFGEPGGAKVRTVILSAQHSISISAVNWSEILAKLGQKNPIITAEKLSAILPGVLVVPFGQAEAEQTAALAVACPSLSLGDRACLALTRSRDATAWTTDRIWVTKPAGAKLKMLR